MMLHILFFFFFKQKTAYEMRISDWSSDVCSSDLEYAGLMTIHKYHESRGEQHRTVCLIPSSAHGTNPASAVMAGFEVVVVDCDANANVDVADLKAKAAQHKDRLGAPMVTYHSTHGVFEVAIREICDVFQIGRASCRDSVCQYEEICVVAQSL